MGVMTDDICDPNPNSPDWTRRSAATWAAARKDYLAGGFAQEVCARHGLSLSTFRWRARTEGWRRSDQPHGGVFEPLDAYELDAIDQRLPCNPADMARLAWANASRAMIDGKLIEARGWSRLHKDLEAIAKIYDHAVRYYRGMANDPKRQHNLPTTPPLRPMEED